MFKASRKPSASNRTVRMPDALIKELDALAKVEKTSLNQIVIQCCEYALAELSPEQRQAVDIELRKQAEEDKELAKV